MKKKENLILQCQSLQINYFYIWQKAWIFWSSLTHLSQVFFTTELVVSGQLLWPSRIVLHFYLYCLTRELLSSRKLSASLTVNGLYVQDIDEKCMQLVWTKTYLESVGYLGGNNAICFIWTSNRLINEWIFIMIN
jgi:hypothetical protein